MNNQMNESASILRATKTETVVIDKIDFDDAGDLACEAASLLQEALVALEPSEAPQETLDLVNKATAAVLDIIDIVVPDDVLESLDNARAQAEAQGE